MSDNSDNYKKKILELEAELKLKNSELLSYRQELIKTNARLEKMISNLGQDLKMTQVLQKFLSPIELPHIGGFEFSSKFIAGTKSGGDYFDIFEHDDKLKFGVLIASSSGYGMSALLLSVLIKLSSQIEARKGLDPAAVMQSIRSELQSSIQAQDFANIFYAVVDRRTFEFKYCSAGSILGLVQIHGDNTLARLLPSTGAIAAKGNFTPMTQSLNLGPRDRLILCTDGLASAKNLEDQSFGAEGIIHAVNKAPPIGVHDVRNEILYQVEKFSGTREPARDQTLIVIEVKDKVIKLAKKTSL